MTPDPRQPEQRPPDCVTIIHRGNTTLTVSGYFKQDAIETAADKMEKAIKAEENIMDVAFSFVSVFDSPLAKTVLVLPQSP